LARTEGETTRVNIHFDAGWENALFLRGDCAPFSWEKGVTCTWTPGNIWTYEWEMHQPALEFKVLQNDSLWSAGSNYQIRRGETRHIYPFFKEGSGLLERFHYFDTPIIVYLPPGYEENAARSYPVCYMHDGQNLFDPEASFQGVAWDVHQTISALVLSDLMEGIIAVGIFNRGVARIHDYTPSFDPSFGDEGAGGGADTYAKLVIEEIKPFIDERYRTKPGPANTGLLGSSLGGLVSLYMARSRPDVFGKVASLSSSFWWNGQNLIRQITHEREYVPIKIYLDSGGKESWRNTLEMYRALIACGYEPGVDLTCGIAPSHSHTERCWAERLHLPLTFLFPPKVRATADLPEEQHKRSTAQVAVG